eukprot:SAG31_NODE_545_length_14238_cov_15.518849_5_plen_194_part_00
MLGAVLRSVCRRAASTPRTCAAAAVLAGGTGGLAIALSTPSAVAAPYMTENRILGNGKHRVGITSWAIRDPREQHDLDTTAKSFRGPEDCMRWLKNNGYECLEMTVDDVRKRWMPTASPREIVRRIQNASRTTGIPICGSLYHITDGQNIAGYEAGAPSCPADVWNPQGLDFQVRRNRSPTAEQVLIISFHTA